MPSVKVEHETSMSQGDAYKKVQSYLENSKGLRSLDGDFKVTFNDSDHSGTISGSKFTGDVRVTGDSPTKVTITVNFGLLFSPFKGKIQETLKTKMTEILG
jgi:hypothetical protein